MERGLQHDQGELHDMLQDPAFAQTVMASVDIISQSGHLPPDVVQPHIDYLRAWGFHLHSLLVDFSEE